MSWLSIAQAIVSLLLIIFVILSSRSSGLLGSLGGESTPYQTKRGMEKTVSKITVILVILFLGLGVAQFILAG